MLNAEQQLGLKRSLQGLIKEHTGYEVPLRTIGHVVQSICGLMGCEHSKKVENLRAEAFKLGYDVVKRETK